jgi:hypothetical protein
MIGKLDPEEKVMMSDWMKNEDGFFAWEDGGIMDQVQAQIESLGWEPTDDIRIEIGGTAVSGIHQGENYNERWSTPYGVRKYNKDAFIVIKNITRDPIITSEPNPDLKQAHPYEPTTTQLKNKTIN